MSGFVRTLQARAGDAASFKGRGSKLGIHNEQAKDLKARLARPDTRQPRRTPWVLRRSKNSQRWLEKRAKAGAS